MKIYPTYWRQCNPITLEVEKVFEFKGLKEDGSCIYNEISIEEYEKKKLNHLEYKVSNE